MIVLNKCWCDDKYVYMIVNSIRIFKIIVKATKSKWIRNGADKKKTKKYSI